MEKKKVTLDVDTGVDDALAISLETRGEFTTGMTVADNRPTRLFGKSDVGLQ